MLVRPAEPAQVRRSPLRDIEVPAEGLPERLRDTLVEVKKIPDQSGPYLAGLRDWAEHGAASRVALTPDEVIARSRPRSRSWPGPRRHSSWANPSGGPAATTPPSNGSGRLTASTPTTGPTSGRPGPWPPPPPATRVTCCKVRPTSTRAAGWRTCSGRAPSATTSRSTCDRNLGRGCPRPSRPAGAAVRTGRAVLGRRAGRRRPQRTGRGRLPGPGRTLRARPRGPRPTGRGVLPGAAVPRSPLPCQPVRLPGRPPPPPRHRRIGPGPHGATESTPPSRAMVTVPGRDVIHRLEGPGPHRPRPCGPCHPPTSRGSSPTRTPTRGSGPGCAPSTRRPTLGWGNRRPGNGCWPCLPMTPRRSRCSSISRSPTWSNGTSKIRGSRPPCTAPA